MSATVNPVDLKLTSIQMVSTPDLRENLSTASRLITAAAAESVKLVVLPEYFCLIGLLKDTDKVRARETFGNDPIQEQLSDIAKANNLFLVADTIPLEAKDPNKVLNITLVFDPSGQSISRYDKMRLFGFQTATERYKESETIESGEEPGLLKISLNDIDWIFGLSIYYDLRFPELYRAIGQVDCHIIPAAFTYTTSKDHWEILLRARAIENQCYVLASAQGGKHQNLRRT